MVAITFENLNEIASASYHSSNVVHVSRATPYGLGDGVSRQFDTRKRFY